ncbi:MAG: globin domain-containing protein [Candidatus Latescibacterota bacterium]
MFFAAIEQDFISAQQSDFIIGAIGGPKLFSGRPPAFAHPHMLISDELFDLREQLLTEAMNQLGAPGKLQEAWLHIDEAFRHVIVKKSLSECKPRYRQDTFLVLAKP